MESVKAATEHLEGLAVPGKKSRHQDTKDAIAQLSTNFVLFVSDNAEYYW